MQTNTATAPTAKQVAFVERLAAEVYGDNAPEFLLALRETGQWTKNGIRPTIDSLLAESRRSGKADRPTPPEGFHYADGTIYKVQRSQGGNLYAKELTTPTDGGKGHFEYAGQRPFARLSADTVLTAEQAAAYGHAHGICGICGATLTDPDSVERGIGPVCATRL